MQASSKGHCVLSICSSCSPSICMALLLTHGTDVMQATCRIMSVVAATLANGGVCPLTNEEVFTSDTVKRVSCHICADRGLGGSRLLQLQSCRCPLGSAACTF
jgi:Glutaminase